eukprot:gene19504-biopygen14567
MRSGSSLAFQRMSQDTSFSGQCMWLPKNTPLLLEQGRALIHLRVYGAEMPTFHLPVRGGRPGRRTKIPGTAATPAGWALQGPRQTGPFKGPCCPERSVRYHHKDHNNNRQRSVRYHHKDYNNNRQRSAGQPSRAEPSRAEPSRAEPSRAEPSRAEPSRAEPSRAE